MPTPSLQMRYGIVGAAIDDTEVSVWRPRFSGSRRLLVCALLAALATGAPAQVWPERPIHIIVPFPPGQGSDLLARELAQHLARAWGQTVTVENRPGANGIIALGEVARSKADGYTLLCTSNSPLVINPALYPKLGYDSETSFAPVGVLADVPMALVANPKLPVRNVTDLIRFAREHPGRLRFASPGNGTTSHLTFERFKAAAGLNIEHVPYKGSQQAIDALLGGQIDMMFDVLPSSLPFVRSGELMLLATGTPNRLALTPDVPTLSEAGIDSSVLPAWYALLAPAATPPAVLGRLGAQLHAFIDDDENRRRLEAQGFMPQGGTPEELASRIHEERAEWSVLVKRLGVSID